MDLKFKAAFAAAPENNLEEVVAEKLAEKGNSQFYCEAPDRTDVPAPESNAESPDSEDNKPSDVEEEGEASGSPSETASPLRVCSDVFERMHRELQEKREPDVYERMHRELQERWQLEAGAARPDHLPLGEPPARPPRRARPPEARLLSVPNIKFRERRAPPAPGAGSLGGLMRRFSKYCVIPLSPHASSYITNPGLTISVA